jgi:hypothetical protein
MIFSCRKCENIVVQIHKILPLLSDKGATKNLRYRLSKLQKKSEVLKRRIEAGELAIRDLPRHLNQIVADLRDLAYKYPHLPPLQDFKKTNKYAANKKLYRLLARMNVELPVKASVSPDLLRNLLKKGGPSAEVIDKFANALQKGYARRAFGPGSTGIKQLRRKVAGMTHELKIGGSAARLLGKEVDNQIIFSRYVPAGLH